MSADSIQAANGTNRRPGGSGAARRALRWNLDTTRWMLVVVVAGLVIAAAVLVFRGTWNGWLATALLGVACAATLTGMVRDLPGQNVLATAGGVIFVSGLAHAVGVRTGIPFGPHVFTDAAGPRLLDTLPWSLPVLWVVFLFNARGVGRLILRPWRKTKSYGLWLMGLTAVLVMVLDLAFEPFASRAARLWVWQSTRLGLNWHGAPLVGPLAWLLVALLILVLITPWLVCKSPRPTTPDYQPLVMWNLMLGLFLCGALAQQLWSAAAFCVLAVGGVSLPALRGARW